MVHLLSPYCWVEQLHPAIVDRSNLSTFRVTVWAANPGLILGRKDLLITGPMGLELEVPLLGKRTLAYPIEIMQTEIIDFSIPLAPPPPISDEDNDRCL